MDEKPTTVMIKTEYWKGLKILAANKEITIKELLNNAIRDYLIKYKEAET